MEPGVLRNTLLPPLLLLMIVASGPARVLTVRSVVQAVLLLAFAQAMLRGFEYGASPDTLRHYASHLFQLLSAYVMFGVGWQSIGKTTTAFWKRFTWLALAAALASTWMTLVLLGRGDVGRLYTPAYGLIFVVAYAVMESPIMMSLAFVGGLLSNKRGPIISVLSMVAAHALASIRASARVSLGSLVRVGSVAVVGLLVTALSLWALVGWANDSSNASSSAAIAIRITTDRLTDLVHVTSATWRLDQATSGRTYEVEAALQSLNVVDYIFGAGAGWTVNVGGVKRVQNIHITPLSTAAVFGLPFAVYLYLYLVTQISRGVLRKNRASLSVVEKMAPLYLAGALVHSLTAYSLFIDLLVFFFAGVLHRSLRDGVSRGIDASAGRV